MFFYALVLGVVGAVAAQKCRGIPESEVRDFLSIHNTLRSRISSGQYLARGQRMPAAKKAIPALKWDCSLEREAQQWADRCQFQHSRNRNDQGENLYMFSGSGKLSIRGLAKTASSAWESEFQKYGFPGAPKLTQQSFSYGIGHATQMAWAKSMKMGCGITTKCQGGRQAIIVCRYKSAGNMLGQNVYEPR